MTHCLIDLYNASRSFSLLNRTLDEDATRARICSTTRLARRWSTPKMAQEMRAMLDQLMGTERDVPLEHRTGRERTYTVRHLDGLLLTFACDNSTRRALTFHIYARAGR